MAAGRWDIQWDRGGAWHVRLGKRSRDGGTPLLIAAPLTMELREVDAPSSSPPRLVLNGVVAVNGEDGGITATREQIEALPGSRYEHRILVNDATRNEPMVWLRGYVSLRDTVSD